MVAPASVETAAWPARSRHSSGDGPGPRPLLPSASAAKTRATNGRERSPTNARTVTGRQGRTGVIDDMLRPVEGVALMRSYPCEVLTVNARRAPGGLRCWGLAFIVTSTAHYSAHSSFR